MATGCRTVVLALAATTRSCSERSTLAAPTFRVVFLSGASDLCLVTPCLLLEEGAGLATPTDFLDLSDGFAFFELTLRALGALGIVGVGGVGVIRGNSALCEYGGSARYFELSCAQGHHRGKVLRCARANGSAMLIV